MCQSTLTLPIAAFAVTMCLRIAAWSYAAFTLKSFQAHDSNAQWYLIAKRVCTYMPGFPFEKFGKKKVSDTGALGTFDIWVRWGQLVNNLLSLTTWSNPF